MRRVVLSVFVALIAFVAYSQQAYSITDVRQIAATSTFYTDGLNPTNIYYHTDGTKYVIGSFKGSFVFNSVSYSAFGSTADMYILKYNTDGSPAFAKVIPIRSSSDALTKLLKGAVATDGSFYITANNNAAFTLDGSNIPASSGVLLKLGANGVLQWYRTVTGVGLFGVRTFSDNTIAVFGMGSAAATWKDESSNTLFVTPYTNTGFFDMLYYRFTAAGAKVWEYRRQQTATSTTPAPAPTNQFIGKDDSIYSAFVRKETVSSYSVVLEKINAAGTFAWSTRLTTQSSNIDINGVSTDVNGNVYVTSTFVGTLSLFHSTGSPAGTIVQSNLYPTAFVGMYNASGTLQWSRRIIDSAKATAAGISYNNGALALVGYFSSTIKWNDGASDFTIINKFGATTTTDGYILILDSTNGNMRQAQGIASNASDYMINIRSSGYGFDMYAFLQGQVDLGSVTVSPVAGAAVGALFHFEDMTCHQFNTPVFGSVKPVVTATITPGNTQSVTISVTMYRQSLGNSPTPVFFNLDSKEDGSAVCRSSSDNIVGSAGVNWAVSTDGCSATYTITQSLSQIVDTLAGNNKWVASLGPDGRSIVYSLPIFATYSVNDNGDCYFAGYKSVVTFRTALSVASTTASFVTADGAAKFTFSGLRITTDNKLEVQGTIAPMIENSEIRAITLSKAGGPSFVSSVSTCNVYNTGCAQTYTADVAAFGGAGTDISGPYNTVMDFYENGVLTRPGSVITYTLSYVIPSNPNVVDSDTITTALTMYTDNTYNTVRTASYNTGSGVLYVKNAVTGTSPNIPTGYRLRYDHGYLCCVNYLTSIPAYDPVSDTGGCRASSGKVEWVDLGTEGINTASIQHTASNTVTPKQYNVQVALAGVFQTMNHANPLTCEVLLISKLDNTGARKSQDANLNDVYVSTTQILVEAKAGVVSSAAKTSVSVAIALVAAVVALVL